MAIVRHALRLSLRLVDGSNHVERTLRIVLELIALVFGDSVSLGGFIPVTGLVICLMLARTGVRWLLSGTTD